jgi:hypothetical protein
MFVIRVAGTEKYIFGEVAFTLDKEIARVFDSAADIDAFFKEHDLTPSIYRIESTNQPKSQKGGN